MALEPPMYPDLSVEGVGIMNENLDHSMLIDIGGLPNGSLPEASELATALDSWWLLDRCQEYGMSKETLIEVATHLQTLTLAQWGDLVCRWFGAGKAEQAIQQAVGEKKIEDVVWDAKKGEVGHELSGEEKVSEAIALGVAMLTYISSLAGPESQSAAFGMGHTRMELVYSWCKDPSQRNQFRANQLSQVAFELTKDAVLDIVRKYPEICNVEAGEFLKQLTTEAGTKEVDFLSPADHIGSVVTALLMGRPDLVPKVNESLAESLETGRVEPSDYDRNAARILLNMKLEETGEGRLWDGSATRFDEQILKALKALFNPASLSEFSSLPEPVHRDVPKEIYRLIYLKLTRNSGATFDDMVREHIQQLKESFSWEGFARYGAAFSDSRPKPSAERIGKILEYAEKVFAKSDLTERQTRVLKLEIILDIRGEEEKWSEADKAKYLEMKQGNYRQHLYQARLKTSLSRHAPKELDGYERLLQAIFEGRTLTEN